MPSSPIGDASVVDQRSPRSRRRQNSAVLRTRWLLVSPALFVVGVFGILPLLIIADLFVPGRRQPMAASSRTFTTEAYVSFLFERDIFDDTLQFVPDYLEIYLALHLARRRSPPSSA